MNLPTIDLATIPGLETAQGLYGSVSSAGAAYEDTIVAIMVYVYDNVPPETFL
ncbi:hypothetical protein [Erythrobacter sp. F6033]|uniref:hypothetical protein n=1 Tax=Erythrobacter sp. F6033 TaxID=2926401 RepID=UPI001FF0EFCD|nr:hypothetical protein [Erythrobacter sp. F6033]MCK0128828.1 hypothetical protein [Erythrobacter sp. F6033]